MTPIQAYLTYAKHIKGYSLETLKAYESDIRQFCQWMLEHRADARWSNISREDIDSYIAEQSQKGLKATTTNREIAAISSIYGYFMRQGWVTTNPTKLENRKKIAETIPNTIPMQDLKNAYNAAQGCTKFMLGILITTGIRIQELLNLKWQDIDFEAASLKIMGKGQRERTVYTTDEVLTEAKAVRQYSKPYLRIFYISQRNARMMIYQALRPFCRARQLSPHAIRHTYATELAKNGVNAALIAKALGHKRIDTTQKYINMAEIEAASNSFTINLNN